MPTTSRTQQRIVHYCDHLKQVLQAKNCDYGDSAFQSPILYPSLDSTSAILVRMSDKIQRIAKLFSSNEAPQVRNESLNDSILDLAGYCILFLIAAANRAQSVGPSANSWTRDWVDGPVNDLHFPDPTAVKEINQLENALNQLQESLAKPDRQGYHPASAKTVEQRVGGRVMSDCMEPLPSDDPRIVAWEAHKQTEAFRVSKQYAKLVEDPTGELWACFQAGWQAAQKHAADAVTNAIQGLNEGTNQ